jgi:DNA excision repair protein ERCC-2
LGRVIRSKTDYGLMILADDRYSKQDKKNSFPKWIQSQMKPENNKLRIDVALGKAKKFYLDMGQGFSLDKEFYFD